MPGNFYIATHEYEDIVIALKMEGYVFDFSYRIHHLSFGNADDFNYIAKKFPDVLLEHPADGLEGSPKLDVSGNPLGFKTNFYLVAVPSYFQKNIGFRYHVYQLISNFEQVFEEKKR